MGLWRGIQRDREEIASGVFVASGFYRMMGGWKECFLCFCCCSFFTSIIIIVCCCCCLLPLKEEQAQNRTACVKDTPQTLANKKYPKITTIATWKHQKSDGNARLDSFDWNDASVLLLNKFVQAEQNRIHGAYSHYPSIVETQKEITRQTPAKACKAKAKKKCIGTYQFEWLLSTEPTTQQPNQTKAEISKIAATSIVPYLKYYYHIFLAVEGVLRREIRLD